MFGWFDKDKKKEEQKQLGYDPTNITVMDIRKGFLFDYDLKSWEVTAEYEYDWGDGEFTYEFKIESDDDVCYMSIEEDDEIEIVISKKLNLAKLNAPIAEKIKKDERPPKQVEIKGITFFRDSESTGFFQNIDEARWTPFISWDYMDEEEDYNLTIEQWDDDEFEASLGQYVEVREISNILPAS